MSFIASFLKAKKQQTTQLFDNRKHNDEFK